MKVAKILFCTILLNCFLSSLTFAQPGIITRIAGDPNTTNFGDGGPARNAGLSHNKWVRINNAGDLYFADVYSVTIRKVSSSTGIITTYAGSGCTWTEPCVGHSPGYIGNGGPATGAVIWNADGGTPLCFDKNDNLLIADYGGIRKVDKNTGIITQWVGGDTTEPESGLPVTLDHRFFVIYDMCADRFGSIYMIVNACIYKLDTSGNFTHIAGILPGSTGTFPPVETGPATSAPIQLNAFGICVDTLGNIYFSEHETRIRKISATGIISTVAGNNFSSLSGFYSDDGSEGRAATSVPILVETMAVDKSGNIFFYGMFDSTIRRVDAVSGKMNKVGGTTQPFASPVYFNDSTGINADSFRIPYVRHMTIDNAGNLYLSCKENSIFKLSHPYAGIRTSIGTDTIVTPACTLPALAKMKLKCTIPGVPLSTDSVTVTVHYDDNIPDSIFHIPYMIMTDPVFVPTYGFGSDTAFLASHVYHHPGLYYPKIYYTALDGASGCQTYTVHASFVCDTNFIEIVTADIDDSISTPACTLPAVVREKILVVSALHYSPQDSVYFTISRSDGSVETKVMPIGPAALYSAGPETYASTYIGYHTYTTPGTYTSRLSNIVSNTGTCRFSESTRTYVGEYSEPGARLTEEVLIDTCSLPARMDKISAHNRIVTCSFAGFNVGGYLRYAADTISNLSYYIDFGDGTNTISHITEWNDHHGHYHCSGSVGHTYPIADT